MRNGTEVLGRPRDTRIDAAVLAATADLLEEVGYLRLSIAAVAERAGTTKPAIYRRWPTKAQLVHEAAFPFEGREQRFPEGDDLRDDIRAFVTTSLELMQRPVARAALAGLLAETSGDQALHADVLGRFSVGTWGWLQQRVALAVLEGEVRSDVQPATVLELIAGSTLVAATMRTARELGPGWVDQIVDVVVAGITA